MPEPLQIPGNTKRQSMEMGALALLIVAFLTVSLITQHPFHARGADLSKAVGVILAAGLTLIMYSFLYRDNPLFKIAENLYVGISLGYGAIITWQQVLRPQVYEPFMEAPTRAALYDALLHRTVPVVLGILLVTRLSRKHGWMSRYAYALLIGWGAGFAIPATTHSMILKQLYSAVAPLQNATKGATAQAFSSPWFWTVALPILGAAVVLIGTVAVLFYFFFSIEHKRASGVISKIGIWFLMVSFGASFGYTVMGRVSLLIGRVQFLLFDWLKLPHK
jgi:hypothetical protein